MLKTNNGVMFSQYPDVLTVDQLAEILQVNRKLAYTLVHSGEIANVRRVGRLYRIPTSSVRAWFDTSSNGLEVKSNA